MQKQSTVVPLSIILMGACESSIFTTPIGSILKNPRDYEGKLVKVSGVVIENINIFIVKDFKLKDDTGEIFVIRDKILPQVGSKATAQGYIYQGGIYHRRSAVHYHYGGQ